MYIELQVGGNSTYQNPFIPVINEAVWCWLQLLGSSLNFALRASVSVVQKRQVFLCCNFIELGYKFTRGFEEKIESCKDPIYKAK